MPIIMWPLTIKMYESLKDQLDTVGEPQWIHSYIFLFNLKWFIKMSTLFN